MSKASFEDQHMSRPGVSAAAAAASAALANVCEHVGLRDAAPCWLCKQYAYGPQACPGKFVATVRRLAVLLPLSAVETLR